MERPNQPLIQKRIFLGSLSVPLTAGHAQKERFGDLPRPQRPIRGCLCPAFRLPSQHICRGILKGPLSKLRAWFVLKAKAMAVANLRTEVSVRGLPEECSEVTLCRRPLSWCGCTRRVRRRIMLLTLARPPHPLFSLSFFFL